jgi:hypothetical protein
VSVDITVNYKGQVLRGQPQIIIRKGTDLAREAVAQEAVNRVRLRLGTVLQHPTGYYSSRVVTDRSSPNRAEVTDGGVIYGPWLEGTGSRNQRSRFKGYRTFRRTAQDLRRDVGRIAGDVMGPILRELDS